MTNSKNNRGSQSAADSEQLEELVGKPVDISGLDNLKRSGDIDALVFELYKEAAAVLAAIAHLYESKDGTGGFKRNQAICAALLIRIAKFMTAVMQLSAKDKRREVVFVLNRCILESAATLEFLTRKNEDRQYDQFIEESLGAERELHDEIQANIKARGGEIWPIEERMLKSIDRVCRASGFKITDVSLKAKGWGVSLRERLKAIGKEELYLTIQRLPSHAVHGSWVDLLQNNLEWDEKGGFFKPEFEWSSVDARGLGPIALLALDSVEPYISLYFGSHSLSTVILSRIEDLMDRIKKVDAAHEKSMHK
ncbi:MAG: hypothetical protein DMG65_22120 [Candidatus Angelobacter sp. Gp1-AA117]|nr:MAG: hypothetical protein DMG65_22120 [Candidatus Angelobacter sp. Gp1-AA117]